MRQIAKHANGDKFVERQNTRSKQWTWRLVSRNNRIVAEGGESYHRRADMLRILYKSYGTLILWDSEADAVLAQPKAPKTVKAENADIQVQPGS